jgi:calcium-binding protein CML
MGCLASKESQLDTVLIEAVRSAKVKPRKRAGKLNELLLKLPILGRGFKEMRRIFTNLDTSEKGSISAATIQANGEVIGFDKQDASLAAVLSDTGLDQSSAIKLNDFMVLLTIVHLRFPDGHMTKVHPDVGHTLSILEEFFVGFDVTKDGCLERKEIQAGSDGEDGKDAGKKLFDQLDWDGNGSISFREFILGLARFAHDEDDDDEEAS